MFSNKLAEAGAFQKAKVVMMAVAMHLIRILFGAKMGYDLWKLRQHIEHHQKVVEAYNRTGLREMDFNESKLEDEVDGSDELEEKSEQLELDEALSKVEQIRVDSLRCSAIAAGFGAFNDLVGNNFLGPSVQLLMASLFSMVWHTNPTILLHFYDTTFSSTVTTTEQFMEPLLANVSHQIASCFVRLNRAIFHCLMPLMTFDKLDDLRNLTEEWLHVIKSESRQRQCAELRATDRTWNKPSEYTNLRNRRKPRQSNAI